MMFTQKIYNIIELVSFEIQARSLNNSVTTEDEDEIT